MIYYDALASKFAWRTRVSGSPSGDNAHSAWIRRIPATCESLDNRAAIIQLDLPVFCALAQNRDKVADELPELGKSRSDFQLKYVRKFARQRKLRTTQRS